MMDKNTFLNRLTNEQKEYEWIIEDNVKYNEKVKFICHKKDKNGIEHGEQTNTVGHILNGQGCSKCRYIKSAQSKRHTTEWFITKANELWDDSYDYSKVKYIDSTSKVCIICHEKDKDNKEHGEFWMLPTNHLHKNRKQGCPKCARERTIKASLLTFNDFVKKANIVHNNKYQYIEDGYINASNCVNIICPIHGGFKQKGTNHLFGQGCPICKESKLEMEITSLLLKRNINFIPQKRFKWLGRQSLDFYLPDYGIAIECQGRQHFINDDFFKSYEEIKKLDSKKKSLCKEHNIVILYYSNLIIDYPYLVYTDKDMLIKEIYKYAK